MVNTCCAFNCSQQTGKGYSFHKFPKDEQLRAAWCHALRRKDFNPSNHSRICSKHFSVEAFENKAFGFPTLKKDAVPTIFDFPSHVGPIQKGHRKQPLDRSPLDLTDGYVSSIPENESILPSFDHEVVIESASAARCIKRKIYVGDFEKCDMISPTKSQKFYDIASAKVVKQQKKIKQLSRKANSLEKKVDSLKSVIDTLKEQNLANEEAAFALKAHFEPDQFEKKIPGKLKPNAIPTIFSNFSQPKPSKSPKKRQQDISHHSDINKQPAKLACLEHSYSTHSSVHVTEESGENLLTPMVDEQCPQEPECALSESELVSTLKANLEDVKRKLREVERQRESLEKKYSTLFNSDQIAFMESAAMQPKIIWSDDTVRKALQLWFSCGSSGYSMLLSQGFPLPSDTTLQKRLGNIPLDDDIIPEVMNMPKLKDSSSANNPNMSLCIRNENSVQEEKSGVHHRVHSQTTTTTTRSVIKKRKPTHTKLPFRSPQAKARADEFEAVGMNVTSKLRKMSCTQQSIVKSLIIKMLTRGLLEELTEDTDLITITNYYDYNNSPDNSNSASSENLSNCEV